MIVDNTQLDKSKVDKLATAIADIVDKEPSFYNAFVSTMVALSWIYESRCDNTPENWDAYKKIIDDTLDIISCAGEVNNEWKLNPQR